MKNKSKIFIEFVGLPASGKTTIYNSLVNQLNSEGCKSISGSIEFLKINKLFRHILPILFNPILTIKVFLFCKKFTKNPKKRKYIFKYLMIDNYIFKRKKFLNYLNNGALHYTMTDTDSIFDLFNLYPSNKIYIIFINTSIENIYKRRINRDNKIKNYNNLLIEHKGAINFFNYLKNNKHKNHKIRKIIEIDGNKPVAENVNILRKYLI